MYLVTVTQGTFTQKLDIQASCLERAIFDVERGIIAPLLTSEPGEAINLNIEEIGTRIPDFYAARYGTDQDAPPTPWHVLAAEVEGSPTLYFTRAAAWVEDKSLAKLYWSQEWAERAIYNPSVKAVPA